jgi:pimeloyl-ACP methyl ester carboxylesterase
MQAVVSNLITHYERSGRGKPVLLLHGWGDTLRTYNNLVAGMSGFDLIRLDLPGFGQTQAPTESWDLDDYAQFVADFLHKLKIKELNALVGHSNGGALAIRAVASGQLKPHKLILLASSGVRNDAKVRRLAVKTIAKTGKAMTLWMPRATRQKLQKKLYGTIGSDMFVAPNLQETFKRTVRQDIQADAAKISLPTLLIYGTGDTATPPKYGGILNGLISNSRLEMIEGAGHFVHHEAESEVIRFYSTSTLGLGVYASAGGV